jgi:transcriptional regulator with XRE-family HTH domain
MAKQTLLNPQAVGRRIKLLREERGLSQRDLSEPGVSYAYISRIEAGMRRPSEKALRMLAPNLGVTPLELETGNPDVSLPALRTDVRSSDAKA